MVVQDPIRAEVPAADVRADVVVAEIVLGALRHATIIAPLLQLKLERAPHHVLEDVRQVVIQHVVTHVEMHVIQDAARVAPDAAIRALMAVRINVANSVILDAWKHAEKIAVLYAVVNVHRVQDVPDALVDVPIHVTKVVITNVKVVVVARVKNAVVVSVKAVQAVQAVVVVVRDVITIATAVRDVMIFAPVRVLPRVVASVFTNAEITA